MLDSQTFSAYIWSCDLNLTSSSLKQAEGLVSSILGDISSRVTTETYDGNGEYSLVLKKPYVTSIQSIKFSRDTVDPTTYFLDPIAGTVRMYTAFPRGFNEIEVQYTAGWTESTMPQDLKYAIYDIARSYLRAGDSLGSNIKRESVDGASIEWGEMDISSPLSIVNSYKRVYV